MTPPRTAASSSLLSLLSLWSFLSLPGVALAEEPPPQETFSDQVTVTATRTEQRLGETAASVVVLSSAELAASAAPTVDDVLRQVPGFSLFRRAGSRFANPTAQGATLRGLGGSGTSRALVLADGVPLNDPFGGWIYWDRVPRAALEQVEVLRGAGSDLYGSGALAGVIQLVRRGADRPGLVAEASAGELGTLDGSAFGSWARGPWGTSLAAEGFDTDGYVLVDPAARGPVDVPASSRHSTAEATVERRQDQSRWFARGAWLDEERGNGTPLQTNDTVIREASAGGDWTVGAGSLALRLSGGDEDYHQTFTAISADRSNERLTRVQSVPSEFAGLSLQASRPWGDRQALVAGLEARQVRGTSDELILTAGGSQSVSAGGRQRTSGVFLEDIFRATPRLSLTLGGRLDLWTNDEKGGEERDESAFSPRATLLFQATGRWAWTASAYRAFRAPTLNELYRAFRVGDVLTLANPDLDAERLTGGETGALWTGPNGRITARGTVFWMEVEQTIANVTLATQPGLITRQRQNLGRTHSRGVETEATARAGRWALSGGYLFTDARVESAPAEPDLVGLRLPQVPRHQVSLQIRFDDPRLASIGLQARWTDEQLDDDLNQLRLGSFATVDALVARPLGHGISVFTAAENLLDERYDIGRTPVRTLGPPRMVRLGVRFTAPPGTGI